jgi:hypothetical protein
VKQADTRAGLVDLEKTLLTMHAMEQRLLGSAYGPVTIRNGAIVIARVVFEEVDIDCKRNLLSAEKRRGVLCYTMTCCLYYLP